MKYKIIQIITEKVDYAFKLNKLLSLSELSCRFKTEFALYCLSDLDLYFDTAKYAVVKKQVDNCKNLLIAYLHGDKISTETFERAAHAPYYVAKATNTACYEASAANAAYYAAYYATYCETSTGYYADNAAYYTAYYAAYAAKAAKADGSSYNKEELKEKFEYVLNKICTEYKIDLNIIKLLYI